MHVALITLGYTPLRESGLAVSAERTVQQLLDAGCQVTVIAGSRAPLPETQQHPALTIVRVPLDRTDWIGFSYRAARLLERMPATRFDVVHFYDVHFAYAYRGPFVATLLQSFRQRMRTLRLTRTSALVRYGYYLAAQQLAEKPALRRAAGLLSLSGATRDEFIAGYGVAAERIILTPNTIDTDFFRPDRAGAAALRVSLGIGPDEQVLLFVGFVTPRKGLDYLAEALRRLPAAPRLVLVGRWDAGYRDRFATLLGPAVKQLVEAGYVADAELPAYYTMADLYVSASLLEGFGYPLAEALACGTPVVAAAGGSVAEVVGPGGIIVAPRNPAALADAIIALLADRRRREQLGLLGQAHILRAFSSRVAPGGLMAAYQHFLPAAGRQ